MRVPRDWTLALTKVREEGVCRACRRRTRLESAHTMGRHYDSERADGTVFVHPDDIVPLCPDCHRAYDGKRLDLLPFLSHTEQARAVSHAGLLSAFRRLTGSRDAPL